MCWDISTIMNDYVVVFAGGRKVQNSKFRATCEVFKDLVLLVCGSHASWVC